mmetsp:Transcript_20791/g.64239  ORF Transcript_20791/g.64239 Transcript_20791/m.64239 type:complete len:338 (+) Transcript_20791:136-1149(+)
MRGSWPGRSSRVSLRPPKCAEAPVSMPATAMMYELQSQRRTVDGAAAGGVDALGDLGCVADDHARTLQGGEGLARGVAAAARRLCAGGLGVGPGPDGGQRRGLEGRGDGSRGPEQPLPRFPVEGGEFGGCVAAEAVDVERGKAEAAVAEESVADDLDDGRRAAEVRNHARAAASRFERVAPRLDEVPFCREGLQCARMDVFDVADDVHDLVIAENHGDVAAFGSRVVLEPSKHLQAGPVVLSEIKDIAARQEQRARLGDPRVRRVDDAGDPQTRPQGALVAVDIAERHHAIPRRRRRRPPLPRPPRRPPALLQRRRRRQPGRDAQSPAAHGKRLCSG